MPLQPVNLLAGFNRDDSPAWSVQDVCNFLPVVADQPGTTTQFKLRTPPGLRPYQRIGSGPIRGEHNAEGRLFVVSAQTLYEVSSKGIGIPRGTVPGVGRVRMAHNQIKNGNQIAIANGQSGYIYNTVTQVFTRITDEGFPGAVDVVFINGYLFWIEPFGRYWLHSDLADGLSYNTLDRGEAESQPDRIIGVAVSQGDVLLFGERTTEFYRNTGQATGTFQSTGTTIDVGCASLHTIQNLDNSVMWLGNDGVVYRLDGLRALPISTRALEKAIAKYDWANVFAFTWEDEGHKVYYITFPDGETFGYDVVVGFWHRRESFGFNRWRLNTAIAWGRKWIGGDFQDGRLWLLDWDYVLEGSDELVATYTTAEVSDSGNHIGIPEMGLLFDVGRATTSPSSFPGQPLGPGISGAAPDGMEFIAFSYQYSLAAGDSPSLITSLRGGRLPDGLSVSSTGLLSGVATKAGDFKFSIGVTDGNGLWAEIEDEVKIAETDVFLADVNIDATLASVDGEYAGLILDAEVDGFTADDVFIVDKPVGLNYVAWSRWNSDDAPPAEGLPWGNEFYVTDASDTTTRYWGGDEVNSKHYATEEEAQDAVLGLSVIITGSTHYTIWLQDSPVWDNRGGFSARVRKGTPI